MDQITQVILKQHCDDTKRCIYHIFLKRNSDESSIVTNNKEWGNRFLEFLRQKESIEIIEDQWHK